MKRIATLLLPIVITAGCTTVPGTDFQYDEFGLAKVPICNYTLETRLVHVRGERPAQEKGRNRDYELTVYANPENGSWTVVGVSTAPEVKAPRGPGDPDDDADELCRMADGTGDYRATKWYQAFFRPHLKP